MPGWGNYKPRKKSQAELDLERRRELGMKFPSDTAELVAIAARARRNVARSRCCRTVLQTTSRLQAALPQTTTLRHCHSGFR